MANKKEVVNGGKFGVTLVKILKHQSDIKVKHPFNLTEEVCTGYAVEHFYNANGDMVTGLVYVNGEGKIVKAIKMVTGFDTFDGKKAKMHQQWSKLLSEYNPI